jgi:UDPglucose--hexose-1-phosphate uridylyltransferase
VSWRHEVRVDPLTGLKTIIAPGRAARPGANLRPAPADVPDPATNPFLPGKEAGTMPEVAAVRPDGSVPDGPGWTVRAFPNKWPAVLPDAPEPPAEAVPDLFSARPAEGVHEVIVNAAEPVASLGDLTPEQLLAAMELWRERMRAHAGATCLHLSVNEQRGGGASQLHTHAQLYVLDFVPVEIARERERFGAYATRTMGGNLLADLVQEEVRRRERLVAVDSEAVLIAPFASRLPYHLMIAPRRARMRFEDDGPLAAGLLHDALGRLRRFLGTMPPLSMWIRTAPAGADQFCWHLDILPRLSHLAALELGTGVNLCAIAPERAAAELRDV